MLLGLRTQEDERFLNFFRLVQEEAKKQDAVFFLDCGEGRDLLSGDIEGEDLFGYLIPHDLADAFNDEYMSFSISEKWDNYHMFADWILDNGSIRIMFNRYEVTNEVC